MSKISLSPDSNGTGIFTIASPNSNTNRTLTLPDDTGTIVTNSGNQAGSFTTLNTSGAVVFNDAGADVDFRVEGDTEANLLFVDASADAVGIGTNAPTSKLQSYAGTGVSASHAVIGGSATGYWDFVNGGNPTSRVLIRGYNSTATENIRLDPNSNSFFLGGNVLVGKTSANSTIAGIQLEADGDAYFTAEGSQSRVIYANRLTSDGTIVELAKAGTTIGRIAVATNDLQVIGNAGRVTIGAGTTGAVEFLNANLTALPRIAPLADNAVDIGLANTARFKDAYIVNGVTTGSDRNDKQDIEELSEAEQRVAVAAKALLRKWRWKDAVAKKGDEARVHFGIIAQDLKAAFEAEGLDAHRYGMFMWNEWWETQTEVPAVEAQEAVYETQTDEEGNEVQVLVSEAVEGKKAYTRTDTYMTEAEAPEGAVRKERMGIRYNELLAFIIAAI